MLGVLQDLILVGTVVLGVIGVVRPDVFTSFTRVAISGARGQSELRAMFGFYIGLGLAPLIIGSGDAYDVAGLAYFTAGLARAVSIFRHKSYEQSNLGSLGFELAAGILLML